VRNLANLYSEATRAIQEAAREEDDPRSIATTYVNLPWPFFSSARNELIAVPVVAG
jgi:hypothetical protein